MSDDWDYVGSDEEETDGAEKAFGGKSVLIAMVDCTEEMFEPGDGETDQVPFTAAMKCCHAIWRSKVVSSPKDVVCLLLVGTEKSQNPSTFKNLYLLQNLSTVKVAMIEELNQLIGDEGVDYFKENIGHSKSYDLKDAFWTVKMIIDEGKASTYQKKIMYFTKNDNPHGRKPDVQKEAVKKFQDLGKVDFTLIPFSDDFNLDNFYHKLGLDDCNVIKSTNIEILMKVVRVKQRVRRPCVRSDLEIAPGVKLGVGVYNFFREARKPTPVSVNKKSNELVETTVNEYRRTTCMPVLKTEERVALKFGGGGEQAVTSKAEIKVSKQVFEQGITLLGFLNESDVDLFAWYRSSGYFLYPDEERVTGSKDLFTALLKRCHTLKKIALVKVVLRRGTTPKVACLVPSLGDPIFPQGFHLFIRPYSDEICSHDFEMKNPPTPELVDLMEQIIKKTTNKKFDVLDVYNPALQDHWRNLERIALNIVDEDDEETFQDYTEPNSDLMQARVGDLAGKFNAEAESCAGLFKSQVSTLSVIKQPEVDMALEVKHNRVEKHTVPVLKQFLDSKRIKTFGLKKAQLVEAVYNHFKQ